MMCPGVSGLCVHGWICSAAGGACGLVTAAPWGFCTVAAGWFFWGSPLLFSGGVAVVPVVVLLGFLRSRESLMSVAQISSMSVSGPMGQVCVMSHSLLNIFLEKP
ncbi:hypothetical protein CHARACLAT_014672 [Characodon lateralis]|uniref:Uncharacterized protein n=1 Tax=Characodon lateralis TaxID=208331 RepID=A0ABU7DUS0_9TELE|nr:hypothetical protein [Characodon lateralis]